MVRGCKLHRLVSMMFNMSNTDTKTLEASFGKFATKNVPSISVFLTAFMTVEYRVRWQFKPVFNYWTLDYEGVNEFYYCLFLYQNFQVST